MLWRSLTYDSYDFDQYDAIIVGLPTYNTGAANYCFTTNWGNWLYNELPDINARGKHVAIFGTMSFSRTWCLQVDWVQQLKDEGFF